VGSVGRLGHVQEGGGFAEGVDGSLVDGLVGKLGSAESDEKALLVGELGAVAELQGVVADLLQWRAQSEPVSQHGEDVRGAEEVGGQVVLILQAAVGLS